MPRAAASTASATKYSKEDLVGMLATAHGITKADAEKYLNTIVSSIQSILCYSTEFRLTGLGTFKVRHREAHMGRNPKTGAQISIPASYKVTFSESKELKDLVAATKAATA